MAARFLFLILFVPLFSYSQSNYKKGYFINNNHDTIFGFINYKDLANNPRSFSFRQSETATASEVYSIREVLYFSIDGFEAFEKHFVSISENAISLDRMGNLDAGVNSDTVFLKVLLRGNLVDMFSFTDKIKTRYYLKDRGVASPVELMYFHDKDTTLPVFQRQLSTLAIKYQKLSDEVNRNIQTAHYTRPSIMKIVSQINDDNDKGFSDIKDKKQNIRLFTGAGVNFSHLTYSGKSVITYESSTAAGPITYRDKVTTSSYLPTFSIGLDLFTNREIQRLIFRNELSLSFLKSNTHNIIQYYYPEEKVAYDYKLFAACISLSPQLIYNVYNAKRLKWNVGGGLSLSFWNYPVNELHQKPLMPSVEYSDMVIDDYMEYNKTTVGVTVRTGVIVNNRADLAIKALINPAYIDNKDANKRVKMSYINLGINYLFTRKN